MGTCLSFSRTWRLQACSWVKPGGDPRDVVDEELPPFFSRLLVPVRRKRLLYSCCEVLGRSQGKHKDVSHRMGKTRLGAGKNKVIMGIRILPDHPWAMELGDPLPC